MSQKLRSQIRNWPRESYKNKLNNCLIRKRCNVVLAKLRSRGIFCEVIWNYISCSNKVRFVWSFGKSVTWVDPRQICDHFAPSGWNNNFRRRVVQGDPLCVKNDFGQRRRLHWSNNLEIKWLRLVKTKETVKFVQINHWRSERQSPHWTYLNQLKLREVCM